MRRLLGLGLLLIMFAGCAGGELGASTATYNGMVADPDYVAKEGDRAALYALDGYTPFERFPILADMTAYDRYERAFEAGDTAETTSLEGSQQLQYAPLGTQVFIVKIRDRQHAGGRVGAEVRILEGAHQGRTFWTPLEYVARLKRVEPTE
jgi:hypothetical protein